MEKENQEDCRRKRGRRSRESVVKRMKKYQDKQIGFLKKRQNLCEEEPKEAKETISRLNAHISRFKGGFGLQSRVSLLPVIVLAVPFVNEILWGQGGFQSEPN